MTPLTYEDIQTVISSTLSSTIKLLSYRLEPFSTNNSGILGTYHSLIIDVKYESDKKNEVKSYTFFVKTVPDANIMNVIIDNSVFSEEVHFYNEIHPQLLKQCKCEKWSPQCYLAKLDVMVLEDLRSQGYQLYQDIILDEKFIKSALTTLARFHASSIITEAQLGKTFRKVYDNVLDEKIFSKFTKMGQVTQLSFETLELIVKRFGLDRTHVPKIVNRVYEMVSTNTTKCSVICHSDLWKNNLMFDNATPPNCILIDYQLLRYHSPVLDIGMLLYLNTTPQFRKKSELRLLKHYYSVLKPILDRSEWKLSIPTYENIVKDYQDYKLVGMAYGCMYLPGILMKSDFVKVLNDSLLMRKWMLESRIDQIRLTMDADPIYESKIKEIVDEFMEEGKRVLGM